MKKKSKVILGIIAGISVCAVLLSLILQKMVRVCDYIDNEGRCDDDFDIIDLDDMDIDEK